MVLLNVTNKESGSEFVYRIQRDFKDVGEVKTAIHRVTGISEQLQLLVHGQRLLYDDNSSLEDYNIFDQAHIHVYQKLMPQDISLDTEWEGSTYDFHGSSENTVLTVKEWFDRGGIAIPPHRQDLIYFGVAMDDNKRLSDYLIHTHNDLSFMEMPPDLELMFTVNVIVPKTRLREEFVMEEGDTLYTLLAKARHEEIIDGRDCYFVYERMRLTMEKTLGDYGIVDGDSLYVVYTSRI